MNGLKTVITFSIKDMVHRKSFIISTIIILVLIVAGTNVPRLISHLSGEDTVKKILVVDSQNVFDGTLEHLNDMNLGFEFEIETEEISFTEIGQKIGNEDIGAAILISRVDNKIEINYVVESMTMMTTIPQNIPNALTTLYTNLQISKLGLSMEQLQSIQPEMHFNIEQTSDQEVRGNPIAIMLLSIVLFYAIYFNAFQVSSSITTEKTSKIMETLVTSTSPTTIVIGKTIGIGVVGLLQVALLAGVGVFSAYRFLDPELISQVLDVSTITPSLAVITFIYFILGYLLFAFLYALTGSTVARPEDVQSVNAPVGLIAAVGFYLSYFTMMNPTSNLNVAASLLPISSPFCMPFRVMMGLATTQDIMISIGILVITIAIISYFAIKIYSNAILNYGTKLSIKDIVRMSKEKN